MNNPNSKHARKLRGNKCPSMVNPEHCPQLKSEMLQLLPRNLLLMLYKYPSQLNCLDLLSLPHLSLPDGARLLAQELSRVKEATQWQQ